MYLSSHLHIVAIASGLFCYSLFESCADLASVSLPSLSSASIAGGVATAASSAQFYLLIIDRDHYSHEHFQSKENEIHVAKNRELQKKQELLQAAIEKRKAIEMELKMVSDSVSNLEKKYSELRTQGDRIKHALKERGSTVQPFHDQTNALFASFKTFHVHCFSSQLTVAAKFAISPPQVSFRFSASIIDEIVTPGPAKLPRSSVVIEAIDVSVFAFDDRIPLLVHSQVS
jgi:hypothetical protein